MKPSEGAKLGAYTLKRKLGEGGMAEIWEAWDDDMRRAVAVKVIKEEIASNREFRVRFIREARAAATLQHENIVPIYDFDRVSGAYLVMPLLSGGSLAGRLAGAQPLPKEPVLAWLKAIASALDYMHKRGVVHRDIKPSNVLFREDGVLLVSDFGLAKALDDTKITRTGTALGTLGYTAPEQIRGLPECASDQYSLGVIAYRMLTGQTPFSGLPVQLLWKTINTLAPSISTHERFFRQVDTTFERVLAKDPSKRFASCTEFVTTLEVGLMHITWDHRAGGAKRNT